jgi:phage terminase large subunit-like protein
VTHAQRATRYAKAVVAGDVLACRYVRLACDRHLSDLKASKAKRYPFEFDEAAADRVCGFVELLPHVKGKWARNRERIRLEDWQCFILANVFGWRRRSDRMRRYRRVYIEVPRKNGKSLLSAAVGLYMLTGDNETGAEVYSGATTEQQAWEVFRPARLMAAGTPDFCQAYGVEVGAKNLHVLASGSRFEPIIGKPGDGASPTFSITDEYHEHATSEQYDTMLTGMIAREQPIAWVITTAGADTAGPCYAQRREVVEMLEGTVENDRLFGIVYTLDAEDDWTAPESIRKANPNLGVSANEDELGAQQREAVNDPRKAATFKTKHANVWVTAAAPYFNSELWPRLAAEITAETLKGAACFGGLDLASKLDIAAYMRLFQWDENSVRRWHLTGRYYIPEARTHDPERRHYQGWVDQDHLIATPGDITDYDYIEADIKADAEAHGFQGLGADPYNATQVITHMREYVGEDVVVEVPQTVVHLSEPMKALQAAIVDSAARLDRGETPTLTHDGNPALAWMIGNVTAKEDRNENVFPRKESGEKKIDGPVAAIIAAGLALRQPAPKRSRYEEEGAGLAYV